MTSSSEGLSGNTGVNAIGHSVASLSLSRDAFVEELISYYTFLTRLNSKYANLIQFPPKGGWPDITDESLSCLKKNATVIDLLKHIPYFRRDECWNLPEIGPLTQPFWYNDIQVTQRMVRQSGHNSFIFNPTAKMHPDNDSTLPSHVILIARGNRDSYSLYVDTDEWVVYWMHNGDDPVPPGNLHVNTSGLNPNGPMWWKFEQSWSPKEIFKTLKDFLKTCEWFPNPHMGPEIWEVQWQHGKRKYIADVIKGILQKHGLVGIDEGEFKHDEAWKEIEEFKERMQAEGYLI